MKKRAKMSGSSRKSRKKTLWELHKKNGEVICPLCIEQIRTFEEATLDHIFPRSLGGNRRLN